MDECRVRWIGYKHPRINHEPWLPDELEELQVIVSAEQEKGRVDWVEVSRLLNVCAIFLHCPYTQALPDQPCPIGLYAECNS